jgi:lipooligosaccharide transport system permease protein
VSAIAPTLVARVVPPALLGARRSHRLVERNLFVYRRTWMIVFSGLFEPIFYLLSIRVGLGSLVGDVVVDGRSVDYAEFVAPALLASAAMNGAIYDSTMNVYYKLKRAHVYDAVLATPLGPGDVALGEIAWALIRGLLYAIGFLAVMVVLGLAGSPWVVLCLPTATLIGFAFAAVGMAGTTYVRTWNDFAWLEAVQVPLFLFSATFFPLSVYGGAAEWIVQLTPLYHGVALCRAFSFGALSWSLLGHVAYLSVMGVVGLVLAARRLDHLLLR